MAGRYPASYRRGAGSSYGPRLSDGRFPSDPASGLATDSAREAMRLRNENRMLDLAKQLGEIDRLRGPVKEPRPPRPLQQMPAWAGREAAARALHNPVWGKALAEMNKRAAQQALRGALKLALEISPLGRVMNIFDFLNLPEVTQFSKWGVDQPASDAMWGFEAAGWRWVACAGGHGTIWDNNPSGCVIGTFWSNRPLDKPNGNYTGGTNVTGVTEYQRTGVYLSPTQPQVIMNGSWMKQTGSTAPQWIPATAASVGVVLDYNPDPLFNPFNQTSVDTRTQVRTANSPLRTPPPFVKREPPQVNVREGKALTHGPMIRLIKKVVGHITEGTEWVNCAYDNLPPSVNGYKTIPIHERKLKGHKNVRQVVPWIDMGGGEHVRKPFSRIHTKVQRIIEHWDQIDYNAFIECAIKNELEDRIIGKLSSLSGKLARETGRPVGLQSGPAL